MSQFLAEIIAQLWGRGMFIWRAGADAGFPGGLALCFPCGVLALGQELLRAMAEPYPAGTGAVPGCALAVHLGLSVCARFPPARTDQDTAGAVCDGQSRNAWSCIPA